MLRKQRFVLLLSIVIVWGFVHRATAAETALQEIYRVAADTTIVDDLYVSASELYIDGVVDGDVIAVAGYVEINGEITGDLMLVAGGVKISGPIGDDVRVLAGGLEVDQRVGGDVLVMAGGSTSFSIPQGSSSGAVVEQGVFIDKEAVIEGEMRVLAGVVDMNGRVAKDFDSSTLGTDSNITLNGEIGGNAHIEAITFEASDSGRVEGTLSYSTPQRITLPDSIAANVVYEPLVSDEELTDIVLQQLINLVAAVTGFAVLGWVLLRYLPHSVMMPVAVLRTQPLGAAWTGLLAVLFIPFIALLLFFMINIFWGFVPALLTGSILILALVLVALFSPLITGLWLGLRFSKQPLTALIIGVLILVPLFRVPLLGSLISTASFVMVLGALVLPRITLSRVNANAT